MKTAAILLSALLALSGASASLMVRPVMYSGPSLLEFFEEFDDFLPSMLRRPTRGASALATGPSRIYSDQDRMIVETSVPGFSKDQLQVSVQGNLLQISGKQTCPQDEKWCVERSIDEVVSLADPSLDLDHVTVSHKDGLLKVDIKKKAPEEPPKRVLQILASQDAA